MSFFTNLFGSSNKSTNSSGNEQQRKSSTTTTGPSFNVDRKSISLSTGSVTTTTPHGSSLSISGPNVDVSTDLTGGGSLSPFGSVKGTLAVNQNTSVGVGLSPMSKSTTIERRKSKDLSQTTVNVPFTGISLSKTTYPQGNPQWNETSENESQIHTNNEIVKSRKMELESIEKSKNMMSPTVYERQKTSVMESIDNLNKDTEKRSKNTSSGSWFSFW